MALPKSSRLSEAVIVLALGLGISSCIVFWTAYSPFYLDPTPGLDGQAIVKLDRSSKSQSASNVFFTYAELETLQSASDVFDSVGGFYQDGFLVELESPKLFYGGRVSRDFFQVLGLGKGVGGLADASDEGPTAVIGSDIKDAVFGSIKNAVPTLVINGTPHLVSGEIDFENWPEALFPVSPALLVTARRPGPDGDSFSFQVIARLRQGVSYDQAVRTVQAGPPGDSSEHLGSRIPSRIVYNTGQVRRHANY